MSLTQQDCDALAIYATLAHDEQLAIAAAMDGMRHEFENRGFKALGDDQLAAVEAAIVRYFLASQGAA